MKNFTEDMLAGEEAAGQLKLGLFFVLPIKLQWNTP
jgi:hypothetical protein